MTMTGRHRVMIPQQVAELTYSVLLTHPSLGGVPLAEEQQTRLDGALLMNMRVGC